MDQIFLALADWITCCCWLSAEAEDINTIIIIHVGRFAGRSHKLFFFPQSFKSPVVTIKTDTMQNEFEDGLYCFIGKLINTCIST